MAPRIDQFGADIVRLNELGVSQHQINDDLRAKIERGAGAHTAILSRLANFERKFGYLIDAIHARDVEAQIKEADFLVVPLGEKLLAAVGYSGPEAWLADYRSWHDGIAAIDRAILSQKVKVEGFASYLDIRARDLQQCSETPPTDDLKADSTVIVTYKTVFLVQRRYVQGREQVLRYFATSGALPG